MVRALLGDLRATSARPIGQDETVELNGEQVPTFFTYIGNADPGAGAGLPGLNVPAGLTPAGLPVGLELDGPWGSDRALLAIGLAIRSGSAGSAVTDGDLAHNVICLTRATDRGRNRPWHRPR
jgi:Asp-tRNA(Asn)/Glu-tRNA(Gln) amidotransferase A subunit family amidase